MSKVTIKLNRKGVRQLLQSPEMENALTGIAFAAQNPLESRSGKTGAHIFVPYL